MSKGYAIALIFTTLSVFGSLFYLQQQWWARQQQQVDDYAKGVQQRAIMLKQESVAEEIKRLNDKLQDDTKARFRPIGVFIDEVQEREGLFLEAATAKDDLSVERLAFLHQMKQGHLQAILLDYTALLEDHGHQMDLFEEDIATKLANHEKVIVKRHSTALPSLPVNALAQGRDLLVLDYLNAVEAVVMDAIRIAGGKVISCGGYFPVFAANVYNPKRGQLVKAKIGIGSYSTALNPDNVILTAGSDTLTINPDGTADYEFSASKRGLHTIDLQFQITNPYTGLVQSGTGSYTYNIY